MTSTIRADSIGTSLSDDEEEENDLDYLEETSFVESQEDPLSLSDVIEQESKSAGNEDPEKWALCRLCAGQAIDPVYIYSEPGESMRLADKINTCLSVKIRKTDNLPKQLCTLCVEKLNWSNAFDEQCLKAEETLESMLSFSSSEISQYPEKNDADTKNPEGSCPLCLDGHMRTCTDSKPHYDSDIVMESSDEENFLLKIETGSCSARKNVNSLTRLGAAQQYLKCGACMNLYHTKDSLDAHKCKPNVQVTAKPWKCLVCDATFPFEERLNFHLRFHDGLKELFCQICKMNFSKELKLFYHHKRYHCEDKSVSCLQCGKLFPSQQDLRLHVCLDGKTRPHVCEICSKGFSDGYTLKRHVVTHLPEKPYKCPECSKSFTQKSRLNKHIASHGVVIETTQVAWRCLQCGETFETPDEAETHARNSHEAKISLIEQLTTSKIFHCEFCNSYFNDLENLRLHGSQHVVEKPYTCKICQTVYKSYAEAVLHWKEHPRSFRVATAYLCEVCGKDMKEMSLLYKHRRKRQHVTARKSQNDDSVRKFVCELCGKSFDNSDDFRVHGRDQCSKFPCDICGNLLPTANSLHAHKRRHSGLRPYVCNICGKSYTQSSHMWTHKRFHMGVKPYACQYCDQRFTIKPDLADHTRKKHTRERPFKCDVCNKAFLTGSVFYQHRLIHRGDRRYKCHFCDKAFTRTEALNNHIKIHTGEKPHACDVCGRCFRQKGDMRKHRRTQHNVAKEELP